MLPLNWSLSNIIEESVNIQSSAIDFYDNWTVEELSKISANINIIIIIK